MTRQEMINLLSTVGVTVPTRWNKIMITDHIEQLRQQAQQVVEHHKTHSRSFFWTPPCNANGRRQEERKKTFTTEIGHYSYSSNVSCSCKNYYYTGRFSVAGDHGTLANWKQLIKVLQQVSQG